MSSVASDQSRSETSVLMPDIYPRLAYDDEHSAMEYLGRVFQLEEIREARVEHVRARGGSLPEDPVGGLPRSGE